MIQHIERLEPDKSDRTMFDSAVANELIDVLNAFLKLKVVGGTVTITDANVIISMNSGSLRTGGGGGGGDTNNIYGGDVWL